jgi:hypothetical protein
MKKRTLPAAPALPTAAPAGPHSPIEPNRNTKKVEDLDERRLLRQIIEEAKNFCRPDRQEHGAK